MNYGEIKKCDIANGEGVRVSLFVSGCTHHCKGCFNSETWDFNYGKPFTDDIQKEIINALSHEYINGLSLLGGEPFEIQNQRVLLPFIQKVRNIFPDKTIWCYTGYTLDKDLIKGGKAYCECTDGMLECIDILVDGEFIENLKDISLAFKGSSNQRIIDIKKSAETNTIVLWQNKSRQI
ncbi:MAG: anaerobic ribonucleoside-triphosphate reductase activating protein [Clostridia bacterium]|nr:anaerobic ribonucleoside-triphosphate reductase activating protein [Clostridia bacterium]